VIEVYDVGTTEDGDPFLVMELLEGQTLEGLLVQRSKLQPQQAIAIAVEATRALEAAHAAGIVHRDLKPANVFLHEVRNKERVVKVLDFGVSKLLTGEAGTATVAGVPIGTPAYMSPEQAEGGSVDFRTDLWSLGVILFEMVSGRLPYEGNNAYAIVGEILNKEPARLSSVVPDVDSALDELVSRCMQKDLARRIGTARELLAALESLLTRSPDAILRGLDEDATHSMEVMRREPVMAQTELVPISVTRAPPKPGVVIALAVLGSSLLFGIGFALILLLRHPRQVEPEIIAVEPSVQPMVQPPPTPEVTTPPPPVAVEPAPSASAPEPPPSASASSPRPKPKPATWTCPKGKWVFDSKGRRVCGR